MDRKEHELVVERGREDAMTAKRLGAELDEERRRRGQTEVILSEAAVALKQALTVYLGVWFCSGNEWACSQSSQSHAGEGPSRQQHNHINYRSLYQA